MIAYAPCGKRVKKCCRYIENSTHLTISVMMWFEKVYVLLVSFYGSYILPHSVPWSHKGRVIIIHNERHTHSEG